jgi:hypothetical protein
LVPQPNPATCGMCGGMCASEEPRPAASAARCISSFTHV